MTQNEFDQLVIELNEYSFNIMRNKRPEYTNENEDVLNNYLEKIQQMIGKIMKN